MDLLIKGLLAAAATGLLSYGLLALVSAPSFKKKLSLMAESERQQEIAKLEEMSKNRAPLRNILCFIVFAAPFVLLYIYRSKQKALESTVFANAVGMRFHSSGWETIIIVAFAFAGMFAGMLFGGMHQLNVVREL